jgi:hypothetical protein
MFNKIAKMNNGALDVQYKIACLLDALGDGRI